MVGTAAPTVTLALLAVMTSAAGVTEAVPATYVMGEYLGSAAPEHVFG
jgi:hypothetical protein